MKIWRKIRSAILVPVPPKYAESFLRTIMSENLNRLILGGAILSLIELVILVTAHEFASGIFYQVGIVLFNILAIPLFYVLRQSRRSVQRDQVIVYFTVAVYLIWSCFYFWSVRVNRPVGEINLPIYLLMVYGVAVLIYMQPIWSATLFLTSFGLYIYLLNFTTQDQWIYVGNIWNALALNLFAWVISRLIYSFQMRTFIAQQELDQARAKSDELLLNILPAKIVTDLKETGATTPEKFDQVTVLFSDVVDFTSVSSQLTPEVLISELNDLFTAFDGIIDQHQCERIKTIGDAYMCVCGMPQAHLDHARHILGAALEMVEFIKQRNTTHSPPWQIRIGVHSGTVIGGVVGTHKYIYDVFGDTINVTARMEQHSAPMHINVSETTYLLTREFFRFTERNPIQVKGIGEIRMYFLEEATLELPQTTEDSI